MCVCVCVCVCVQVLDDKFTIPSLGAIPYSKRSKYRMSIFDVLCESRQRALFMVDGFFTTLHDSKRNEHNYDLKLDKVSYNSFPSLGVTNEIF